jgi:hypothetical protein
MESLILRLVVWVAKTMPMSANSKTAMTRDDISPAPLAVTSTIARGSQTCSSIASRSHRWPIAIGSSVGSSYSGKARSACPVMLSSLLLMSAPQMK